MLEPLASEAGCVLTLVEVPPNPPWLFSQALRPNRSLVHGTATFAKATQSPCKGKVTRRSMMMARDRASALLRLLDHDTRRAPFAGAEAEHGRAAQTSFR